MLNNKTKVVLLACPWIYHKYAEFQSQQLGLGYVGSYIQEHKTDIDLLYIDPMLDGGCYIKEKIFISDREMYRVGITDDSIIQKIGTEPDYIFINAPFTDSRFVLYPLCDNLKKTFQNSIIVIGGVLATSMSLDILNNCSADIVVRGEGELAALDILKGIYLDNIDGVIYKKGEDIFGDILKQSRSISDLDCLPSISKCNFRNIKQYIDWSPRGNKSDKTFSYITSRGCPFSCEFCSVPNNGQKCRYFSIDRVINDIQYMIDNYGINEIEIEDDNFTLDKDHSITILKYIIELRKTYPIKISFPNGLMINKLDEEQIIALKEAGTEILYLPVESGDVKNLMAMNKPFALTHLDKVIEVANLCKKYDIDTGAFIILGYPGGRIFNRRYKKIIKNRYSNSIISEEDVLYIKGEDDESFEKTLLFVNKLVDSGVKFISALVATPYPGTKLFDICNKFSWLRYRKDNMITTVSYSDFKEEFINITTPWSPPPLVYKRWKKISGLFDTKYNVVKEIK